MKMGGGNQTWHTIKQYLRNNVMLYYSTIKGLYIKVIYIIP